MVKIPHILVVDDDDRIRNLLKEYLNDNNFMISTAQNANDAKIKLKHLLQKHATNLKRGDDDTEFKLTLKHLLDKHVVKGGEEKAN